MAENLMADASIFPSDTWKHCLECLQSIRMPLVKPHEFDSVTLTIGSYAIRLVFHSKGLRAVILPAFHHLLSEDFPDLTLHLHDFDSAPEGQKLAMLLDPPEDGDAFRLMDDHILTCFTQAQGKIVSAIDWGRNEAYWIVRSPTDVSYMERSSPLRPLLAHWLGRRGLYLAHGAAVGDSRGGVLILGHGGAGKSTTALVCLEAGLEYVADDHCLVEAGLNPAVHSLFSTGKLAEQQLHHFPQLSATSEAQGRPNEEKVVLYLSRLAGLPLQRRLSLRAILLAHITERRETSLRLLAPAQAFRAIVPSCALHFPLARPDALGCFGRLVRDLPAYVLELGNDHRTTPMAIRSLLATQSREQ